MNEVYTGCEISVQSRSQSHVDEVEAKRKALTPAQRAEFCRLADQRCRAAYDAKAKWFLQCVNSKSNRGRDQLYVWIRHWLSAYVSDPEMFRKRCTGEQ